MSPASEQMPRELPTNLPNAPLWIGQTPAMQQVARYILAVAASEKTGALILGEHGTGKELVARAIHQHSRRKHERFLPINCGGLPAQLVEAELFGSEPGPLPMRGHGPAMSSRRTMARSSSMRSGNCHWSCSRRCCVSCRRSTTVAWAVNASTWRMCACWRRRCATCKGPSPPGPFAPISFIGSMCGDHPATPAGTSGRICPIWWGPRCASARRRWASRGCPPAMRTCWPCSARIPGRATCANCETC